MKTLVAMTMGAFVVGTACCGAFSIPPLSPVAPPTRRRQRRTCALPMTKREGDARRHPFPGADLAAAACLMVGILTTPLEVDVRPNHNIHSLALPPIVATVRTSVASAMTEEQVLVSDVWREVTRQYLDTTYNGLGEEGWKKKRLEAIKRVTGLGPDDRDTVYESIRTMLKALGDPYTRFLTPEQFDALAAVARGGSAGLGVQLVLDPASGGVVVANTVEGGPADKAGILSGDVVVDVDGTDMAGATAEVVASKCRGEPGTDVNIAVRHGGDGKADNKVTYLTVRREKVKVNPVVASTFQSDNGGKKVGLVKLSSFSQETASQVADALKDLKGSSAIVIDLRGNVGGYMPAGVDVAKLFLPPQAQITSEVNKSGRTTVYTNDGVGSDTNIPLYLLVDEKTASASEIFAAALQDNKRATIVGETKTFGKGRIQNVQPLEDGSAVAVTKAKYVTPAGRDIHKVGIAPDKESKACKRENTAADCLAGIL